MKYFIALFAGLLLAGSAAGQIASPTQFGLIKVGTNLSVDAQGRLNAAASGGGSGSSVWSLNNGAAYYNGTVGVGTDSPTSTFYVRSNPSGRVSIGYYAGGPSWRPIV